jgi:hypothetical protein
MLLPEDACLSDADVAHPSRWNLAAGRRFGYRPRNGSAKYFGLVDRRWVQAVSLIARLVLWLSSVAGVSVAAIAWRPVFGQASWSSAIRHGELVLVAITVAATALIYAAIAAASRRLSTTLAIVLGLGVVFLVFTIGAYQILSEAHPDKPISDSYANKVSYILLAISVVMGVAATCALHRADPASAGFA